MVDGLYSVKEASNLLACTKQNIYRQKDYLISKGLMEEAETGTFYLNEKGINYLREKRIETMKSSQANSQDFNTLDSQANSSVENPLNPMFSADNTELIEFLKEQIQELKKEREYWQREYHKKDDEVTRLNDRLQELSTGMFQKFLATAEQNQEQAERTKKGFWYRIFH